MSESSPILFCVPRLSGLNPINRHTRPLICAVEVRGAFVTGALAIPVALLALRETRMGIAC
jgi:hypothetical protein